jgi:hypothetical protein
MVVTLGINLFEIEAPVLDASRYARGSRFHTYSHRPVMLPPAAEFHFHREKIADLPGYTAAPCSGTQGAPAPNFCPAADTGP